MQNISNPHHYLENYPAPSQFIPDSDFSIKISPPPLNTSLFLSLAVCYVLNKENKAPESDKKGVLVFDPVAQTSAPY